MKIKVSSINLKLFEIYYMPSNEGFWNKSESISNEKFLTLNLKTFQMT